MHLRRPSFTAVIALLALFFALGGTAIAARHYFITSTQQIKPNVLKQLKGNSGANGAQGPAGPAGATGPAGPAGPSNLSALTSVSGPIIEVPTGTVEGASAFCPAGSHAIGGGGSSGIAGIDVSEMEANHQDWFIIIYNQTGITVKIHAEAECAGAGQAVAASISHAAHPSAGPELQRLVAQVRNEVQVGKR